MTLLLIPDPVGGPALPASAPPGLIRSADTKRSSDGATPSAFAALVQAVVARQGGIDTTPPAGGTPPTPDALTALSHVLTGLTGPGAGSDGVPGASNSTDQFNAHPLLDRLAEVGTMTDDRLAELPVLEALMAYLLTAQPVRTEAAEMPALPDDLLSLLRAPSSHGLASDGVAVGDGEIDRAGSASAAVADDLASPQADLDAAEALPPMVANLSASVSEAAGHAIAVGPAPSVSVAPGDEPHDAVGVPVVASAAGDSESSSGRGREQLQDFAAVQTGAKATDEDAMRELATRQGLSTAPSSDQSRGMAETMDVPAMPVPGTGGPTPASRMEMVEVSRPVTAATLPAEIADTVRMAAFRGDAEVRLVLNPPDLGHLDIRITSGEGGLRVTLEASQGGTRDLIDRSLVQLQQALESRDVRVDRIEVRTAEGGRSGMDASGQQSQHRGQSASEDGRPEWSPVAALDGVRIESTSTEGTAPVGDGRVDVLA